MPEQNHSDILIIGAGLVGCSLACALANSGYSVTLLENHLVDLSQAANPLSRPISLAYGSHQQLQQLNVWPELTDFASPIKQVHASEQGAFGQLQFKAEEYDLPALGYVVPFDCLRHALYRHALNACNEQIHCIESLTRIEQSETGVNVVVQQAGTEQYYSARCLVAADGTRSQCRDMLGITTEQTDHHEVAMTASLTLNRQLHSAFERFSQQGIVAVLPRQNKQAGMVWTMTPKLAEQAKNWNEHDWQQQLQQLFGYRLGRIETVKPTASYPLLTTVATQQTQGRAILLGNSAHTFYPIAAQGFNLSLRDTSALAQCLINHNLDQLDDAFNDYLNQRLTDQQRVQKLIGFTAEAFDLNLPGLKMMRGKALLGLNIIPTLKDRLAKQTLGLKSSHQHWLGELRRDD